MAIKASERNVLYLQEKSISHENRTAFAMFNIYCHWLVFCITFLISSSAFSNEMDSLLDSSLDQLMIIKEHNTAHEITDLEREAIAVLIESRDKLQFSEGVNIINFPYEIDKPVSAYIEQMLLTRLGEIKEPIESKVNLNWIPGCYPQFTTLEPEGLYLCEIGYWGPKTTCWDDDSIASVAFDYDPKKRQIVSDLLFEIKCKNSL